MTQKYIFLFLFFFFSPRIELKTSQLPGRCLCDKAKSPSLVIHIQNFPYFIVPRITTEAFCIKLGKIQVKESNVYSFLIIQLTGSRYHEPLWLTCVITSPLTHWLDMWQHLDSLTLTESSLSFSNGVCLDSRRRKPTSHAVGISHHQNLTLGGYSSFQMAPAQSHGLHTVCAGSIWPLIAKTGSQFTLAPLHYNHLSYCLCCSNRLLHKTQK